MSDEHDIRPAKTAGQRTSSAGLVPDARARQPDRLREACRFRQLSLQTAETSARPRGGHLADHFASGSPVRSKPSSSFLRQRPPP
jgi:hypothetical protein